MIKEPIPHEKVKEGEIILLTGKHIAVLGGDARQLEIIKKLNELDAQISLVGFDQLEHYFNGASKVNIDDIDVETIDAVLLPVSGTNEQGVIETIFSNQEVTLTSEWLMKTPDHCIVYSGISNSYLDKCGKESHRDIVKLFERDDVAIYNSVPTAEGTIMMVIQNTDITIHQSEVIILGLGRVGMTLARTFHALGAHVKVGANKPAELARITEMGLIPFHIKDLAKHVTDIDICINTIPARVVTGEVISQMPTQTLIIDIASKPGGTDFRYADRRGVKAILAPGLPGIVAPKSAGRIIANVLAEILLESFLEEENE